MKPAMILTREVVCKVKRPQEPQESEAWSGGIRAPSRVDDGYLGTTSAHLSTRPCSFIKLHS
jgi:hypothetical protein